MWKEYWMCRYILLCIYFWSVINIAILIGRFRFNSTNVYAKRWRDALLYFWCYYKVQHQRYFYNRFANDDEAFFSFHLLRSHLILLLLLSLSHTSMTRYIRKSRPAFERRKQPTPRASLRSNARSKSKEYRYCISRIDKKCIRYTHNAKNESSRHNIDHRSVRCWSSEKCMSWALSMVRK